MNAVKIAALNVAAQMFGRESAASVSPGSVLHDTQSQAPSQTYWIQMHFSQGEHYNWRHTRRNVYYLLGRHPSWSLFLQTCRDTNTDFYPIVWSLSRVSLFVTPWTAARQASLSFTISRSLFKLLSVKSVILPHYLILCCPLPLLPSIFAIPRVFSSELAVRIWWPKYWSFSISPSNDYSELIFFRILGRIVSVWPANALSFFFFYILKNTYIFG